MHRLIVSRSQKSKARKWCRWESSTVKGNTKHRPQPAKISLLFDPSTDSYGGDANPMPFNDNQHSTYIRKLTYSARPILQPLQSKKPKNK